MNQALGQNRHELEVLANEWERISRRKFSDAQLEKSTSGKSLIEHGAMCYFNCAQALREVLGVVSPPT